MTNLISLLSVHADTPATSSRLCSFQEEKDKDALQGVGEAPIPRRGNEVRKFKDEKTAEMATHTDTEENNVPFDINKNKGLL